ncbi:hypothetical protein BVC93_22165 [Mycobacterium sp. MS1601]|uniref:hypothetical protein n=1 Tax=Mycobacterium sp. MS1601 TaxID=1936029 RepID=UPI0009793CBA|nr:hypothetical protein [Mycobacterium sp. MS1601]AQA04674.1 hypothetical protein BVC93_22165 [Mycobacterium sp. MS1601]
MRYRTQHEELVVEGLRQPVSLGYLHAFFEYDLLDNDEAQQRTLEMIRFLVGQQLFQIGSPASFGYHQWLMPLDEAIAEITSVYVDRFAERGGWEECIELYLSAKGKELGQKLVR